MAHTFVGALEEISSLKAELDKTNRDFDAYKEKYRLTDDEIGMIYSCISISESEGYDQTELRNRMKRFERVYDELKFYVVGFKRDGIRYNEVLSETHINQIEHESNVEILGRILVQVGTKKVSDAGNKPLPF